MDAHSFSVEDVRDVLNAYKVKFGVPKAKSQSVSVAPSQSSPAAPSQSSPAAPSQSNPAAKAKSVPMATREEILKLAKSNPNSIELHYTGGRWRKQFNALKAYSDKHGHCNVPRVNKEYPKLGEWVNKQRTAYKDLLAGKRFELTKERILLLESIGFEWDPHEAEWNEQFAKLKAYKQVHGHCNVPKGYEDDPQLGIWVNKQRSSYKDPQAGKSFAMTPERIDKLQNIGFEWDPYKAAWQEQYGKLKAYRDDHGHCNVPAKYKDDPELGNWVGTQRTAYKKAKLTPERIGKLNDIGFEWSRA